MNDAGKNDEGEIDGGASAALARSSNRPRRGGKQSTRSAAGSPSTSFCRRLVPESICR